MTASSTFSGTAARFGIAVDALDGAALGIDGVDDAAEGILQQVAHQDVADAARRGAGPEDGDRTWTKE